ncbi:hypothetical protein Tco_0097477 [Tanacetum coccineum]
MSRIQKPLYGGGLRVDVRWVATAEGQCLVAFVDDDDALHRKTPPEKLTWWWPEFWPEKKAVAGGDRVAGGGEGGERGERIIHCVSGKTEKLSGMSFHIELL